MMAFLDRVPIDRIRRTVARLAPGRDFASMSQAEVIHLLGVSGVASLAGVTRPMVLQAVGPEACAIADLIEPAPYGNFPDVGRRYPDAAPMLQAVGGGYITPRAPTYAPPVVLAESWAADVPAPLASPTKEYTAPSYSPDLVSVDGQKTYELAPMMATPVYSAPMMTQAAPVYSPAPMMTPIAPVYAPAPAMTLVTPTYSPAPATSAPIYAPTTTTVEQFGQRSFGTPTYGATEYSAPTGGMVARTSSTVRTRARMGAIWRNPGGLTPEQEAAVNEALLAGASPAEVQTIVGEYNAAPLTSAPVVGGGWPGAVPFKFDAWDFSKGIYILQPDDTFAGLAATYLEHPSRYMEIWSLQPYRYTRAIDPSSVRPGKPLLEVLSPVIMPDEATARAKELARTGAPRAPAIGGPGGKGAPWSTGKKVAVGLGVAAVLGLGGYAVTR